MDVEDDITGLLKEWSAGDEAAFDRLSPYVYRELRRLARRYMSGEGAGHTLQPTALVNEAFLRLVKSDVDYQSRKHFFVIAARMMRRILVDHARGKRRRRRGGDSPSVTLDEGRVSGDSGEQEASILDLDAALGRLQEIDADMANAVELIFFGGLSHEATAETLGTSRTRVYEDVRFARAWLRQEMS